MQGRLHYPYFLSQISWSRIFSLFTIDLCIQGITKLFILLLLLFAFPFSWPMILHIPDCRRHLLSLLPPQIKSTQTQLYIYKKKTLLGLALYRTCWASLESYAASDSWTLSLSYFLPQGKFHEQNLVLTRVFGCHFISNQSFQIIFFFAMEFFSNYHSNKF